MMKHTEIHVLYVAKDVTQAVDGGLPNVEEDTLCASCGNEIHSTNKFAARALVLDEDTHWVLCLSCAAPAIRPKN